MEKIACYIRVSSEEQKLHGISLDAQRDKLKEYAVKHDLKIVGWYEDEGVSGRKLIRKRPELQRMLNDAHAGKFERIIFIKLDRFFRSVAEYHECMKYIDPVIWTATEEKYDLSTANGRAFVNMKLTIAELEADQTGERIKIVNDYKVKNGQAISGYKALTMGFITAKVDGVKKVVKNPDTAPMVSDFLNHYLTYQNMYRAFLFAKEKYNSHYSYNAFKHVLRDTKIYGYYRGNPNYCEPYITEAEFNKLQDIMSKNIKHAPTGKVYLFSGLMHCPKCGHTLAGRTCGRYQTTYYYYRCPGVIRERTCDFKPQIKGYKMEADLLEKFDQFVSDYITNVQIRDNKQIRDNDVLKKRISSIKTEMEKLKRMYRKDDISEAEYDHEMAELKITLSDLEAQLVPDVERDLTAYNDILNSDWKSIYSKLTKENKRAFWRKYISRIDLDLEGNIKEIIFL